MTKTFKNKILVIEDDVDVQDLMSAFFKSRGYEVAIYEAAEAAIDDLQYGRVKCGVIVTDLMLPNMSGIEFTKRTKALGIDIPIILMTANKKPSTNKRMTPF